MYNRVYLSPHFDDAALSCGGSIHKQSRAEEKVLVITIFAGKPDPELPLSTFAEELRVQMGGAENLIEARKAEDEKAIAVLGAEVVWLDLRDCIYRGNVEEGNSYYVTNQEVFGTIHPCDQQLYQEVASGIRKYVNVDDKTIIYAPLGVGDHVDHQITRQAAWALWEKGWRVVFYEDYPYSDENYIHFMDETNTSTVESVVNQDHKARLVSRLEHFSSDNLSAKIESVKAYTSQLKMLFGNTDDIDERITAYASQYDSSKPAEQYWIPSETS